VEIGGYANIILK